MSDEYQSPTYSSFWPLTVLAASFVVWFGYQDVQLFRQGSNLSSQYTKAIPTIQAADTWTERYRKLMEDLVQTGKESPFANTIANEAVQAGLQAGLIQVNQQAPANGAAPATPAPKTP